RVGESVSPLSTFVALPAMEFIPRLNARKRVFQRQVASDSHHRLFLETGERQNNSNIPADRAIHDLLESGKELRRGIGKRIGLQGPQHYRRHYVKVTPKERLGQKKHIAARQEDGLVRRVGTGHTFSSEAPVVAVQISNVLFQDRERFEVGLAK